MPHSNHDDELLILRTKYQAALEMIEKTTIERNQAQYAAAENRNEQYTILQQKIISLTALNSSLTQQLQSMMRAKNHDSTQEILRLNSIIARLASENTELKTQLRQTRINLDEKRASNYSDLKSQIATLESERNGLHIALQRAEERIAQLTSCQSSKQPCVNRSGFFEKAPGPKVPATQQTNAFHSW